MIPPPGRVGLAFLAVAPISLHVAPAGWLHLNGDRPMKNFYPFLGSI